ncbi:FUSC family protein [Butyricicoccus sp.]|uniref:FUSC family protein n=1 Tax=Butyricicoccus sp. TaxID=2049021 RepID=UPI003F1443BE
MAEKLHRLPPVGMRIIKSSVGVMLGFVAYFLRGCQGAPFYTALSVLWCMRPYDADSKNMAIQRTIGTFLGGMYGLVVILIDLHSPMNNHEFVRFMVIGLCIIPIIYTTVLLKRRNASYFACVVFLSITVMHITDPNPYLFVLNRVLDTLIGIAISIVVNRARLPHRTRRDVLFLSGMNNTLTEYATLNNYSRVELNRMLDDGMNFTVSTIRTPASLVEDLRGIRLRLPVIAMDGAVLYDINENRYLNTAALSADDTSALCTLLEQQGMDVFVNVIEDDRWMIYYDMLCNEAERSIYAKLRCSPYRNYMHRRPPEGTRAVYLMVIEHRDRVQAVYDLLERTGWTARCRVVSYDSDDYPDYRYIKIYHSQATRENMADCLARRIGMPHVVRIGSVPGQCDVVVPHAGNAAVKALRRLYEPYLWEKDIMPRHGMDAKMVSET